MQPADSYNEKLPTQKRSTRLSPWSSAIRRRLAKTHRQEGHSTSTPWQGLRPSRHQPSYLVRRPWRTLPPLLQQQLLPRAPLLRDLPPRRPTWLPSLSAAIALKTGTVRGACNNLTTVAERDLELACGRNRNALTASQTATANSEHAITARPREKSHCASVAFRRETLAHTHRPGPAQLLGKPWNIHLSHKYSAKHITALAVV